MRIRLLPGILGLLGLIVLLFGCGKQAQGAAFAAPWQPGDLRALEGPNTTDAAYDLVAGYARLTATDLELRFDLLGSPEPLGYDLYVVISRSAETAKKTPRLPLDLPTKLAWDLALGFPSEGLPRGFGPDGLPLQIRPRIERDGLLDAAVVRLSLRELARVLPGNTHAWSFEAFLVRPGDMRAYDALGPLQVDGTPPAAQARLLLAFWDTFPSATPAQALRRWDGAHTGPYGQRHGLGVLLREAQRTGIPLALLDLKRPEQLSALEAVGGLAQVQMMAKDGLLTLPDLRYGDPQAGDGGIAVAIRAAEHFHLPASQFLYGSLPVDADRLPGNHTAAFARLSDTTHVQAWGAARLVPLPGGTLAEDEQVNEEGLSLATRTVLLNLARSGDSGGLVTLGGSLPDNPWGDSLIAAPALAYIAGHPWLRPLDGADLLALPAGPGTPNCPDLLCLASTENINKQAQQIRQALETAPDGLFTELAWQAYRRLTDPTPDTRLQTLRADYLGPVVGPLLAAARWNASPADQTDCAADLDWDGLPECILASKNTFLVLDLQGGRLVLAAARVGKQPLEFIGPRAQFAVGLGDPLEWQPGQSLGGDPQDIPGAFADSDSPWQSYQGEMRSGQITLTLPNQGAEKTFRLTSTGFIVQIKSLPGPGTQVPLAFINPETGDPHGYANYQPGAGTNSAAWQWEITGRASVQIKTTGAKLTPHSFTESRELLLKPEDPNLAYPPGHFLPFPLAVVDVQAQGDYTIEVSVK